MQFQNTLLLHRLSTFNLGKMMVKLSVDVSLLKVSSVHNLSYYNLNPSPKQKIYIYFLISYANIADTGKDTVPIPNGVPAIKSVTSI